MNQFFIPMLLCNLFTNFLIITASRNLFEKTIYTTKILPGSSTDDNVSANGISLCNNRCTIIYHLHSIINTRISMCLMRQIVKGVYQKHLLEKANPNKLIEWDYRYICKEIDNYLQIFVYSRLPNNLILEPTYYGDCSRETIADILHCEGNYNDEFSLYIYMHTLFNALVRGQLSNFYEKNSDILDKISHFELLPTIYDSNGEYMETDHTQVSLESLDYVKSSIKTKMMELREVDTKKLMLYIDVTAYILSVIEKNIFCELENGTIEELCNGISSGVYKELDDIVTMLLDSGTFTGKTKIYVLFIDSEYQYLSRDLKDSNIQSGDTLEFIVSNIMQELSKRVEMNIENKRSISFLHVCGAATHQEYLTSINVNYVLKTKLLQERWDCIKEGFDLSQPDLLKILQSILFDREIIESEKLVENLVDLVKAATRLSIDEVSVVFYEKNILQTNGFLSKIMETQNEMHAFIKDIYMLLQNTILLNKLQSLSLMTKIFERRSIEECFSIYKALLQTKDEYSKKQGFTILNNKRKAYKHRYMSLPNIEL